MNRTLVASSNIRSVGYDSQTKTLEVEFHSGGVYQYANVPEVVHNSLLMSNSKGAYFHDHIKDRYPVRQVS